MMMTYEQSVRWLRSQPEHNELVRLCYLDEDNYAAAVRFAASEEFSDIVGLLKLGRRGRILDVGCGNGIASYAFASRGHDVEAIDPDPSDDVGYGAARRLAERIPAGSMRVSEAFAEQLPFEDASFDVVYTRQAVHHFGDLQQGISECYRVLKPGGLFLATREHVVDNDEQLQQFLSNHLLQQHHGGENAYPRERYEAVMRTAGFRTVQTFGPFDTVINHFPDSNAEMRSWIQMRLRRRLGAMGFVSPVLGRLRYVDRRLRRTRSSTCNTPGRLFSFLCMK